MEAEGIIRIHDLWGSVWAALVWIQMAGVQK